MYQEHRRLVAAQAHMRRLFEIEVRRQRVAVGVQRINDIDRTYAALIASAMPARGMPHNTLSALFGRNW